ncbi:MAG TPA: hypothetical protein VML94_02665 [Thermoplasmata archaeon]|nr:hypothetical protein [Thermoplasmata archaeon]
MTRGRGFAAVRTRDRAAAAGDPPRRDSAWADGLRGFRSAAQTISPARTATGRSFSAGGNPHSKSSVYAQYGLKHRLKSSSYSSASLSSSVR